MTIFALDSCVLSPTMSSGSMGRSPPTGGTVGVQGSTRWTDGSTSATHSRDYRAL